MNCHCYLLVILSLYTQLTQPELIYTYLFLNDRAGFGGAYAAHLLTKQAPSLRVVVVEQSGRVGGRLHSADSDGVKDKKGAGEANKDELGGMRIFPSAGMEKVRTTQHRPASSISCSSHAKSRKGKRIVIKLINDQ